MAGKDQGPYTLWVGNIPPTWTEGTFHSYFNQFGRTQNTYLGGACGTSSGDQWGKVNYLKHEDAEEALKETDGLQVECPPGDPEAKVSKLTVRWYIHKKEGDHKFEELTPEGQLEQADRYATLGLTGRKFTEEKGWHYAEPRIPDHIKEMIGKGVNKEQMNQFLNKKGKDKGK